MNGEDEEKSVNKLWNVLICNTQTKPLLLIVHRWVMVEIVPSYRQLKYTSLPV